VGLGLEAEFSVGFRDRQPCQGVQSSKAERLFIPWTVNEMGKLTQFRLFGISNRCKTLFCSIILQILYTELNFVQERSQAVARIADRTASQYLRGSRDVIGYVTIW